MGQTYNANVTDSQGEVRFEGEIVYTDSNATTPAPLNATSPVGTITAGY